MHEHHAGCSHHEDDHSHHHVHMAIGQLCCQGQCSHPEHQAGMMQHIHAAEIAALHTSEKSKKKKRRSPLGFTLTSLLAAS